MKFCIFLKLFLTLALVLTFLPILNAGVEFSRNAGVGAFNDPVPPDLLYPISEKVDLINKDFLEFKWEILYTTDTRYYDFRLYKGYNMYASNLILKQQLPNGVFSFQVKASLFEENQVYTWSLRRANNAGIKSEASFNSFKVIKENQPPKNNP